ncbi:MAG: hypothetical protein J3K34DRAFT_444758 [Monoraphidium minutum]|nr:MAG: hypothetical protein J3K34DRAFT_444758 [Monoraphidium minutum]
MPPPCAPAALRAPSHAPHPQAVFTARAVALTPPPPHLPAAERACCAASLGFRRQHSPPCALRPNGCQHAAHPLGLLTPPMCPPAAHRCTTCPVPPAPGPRCLLAPLLAIRRCLAPHAPVALLMRRCVAQAPPPQRAAHTRAAQPSNHNLEPRACHTVPLIAPSPAARASLALGTPARAVRVRPRARLLL